MLYHTNHRTTRAPAMTATNTADDAQICVKPESRRYDASELPVPLVVPRGGAVPAMTVPVSGTEVAPFGAFPTPCPFASRDEYAAAAPVAARLERKALDSAALVGAAKTVVEAGGVMGASCVSVVAKLPPDVPV